MKAVNPIQDGTRDVGWAKRLLPASFSPVTSTKVTISPKNFLTFSFNPFDRLMLNFKFASSASPKLLNLNQDHPNQSCSSSKINQSINIGW